LVFAHARPVHLARALASLAACEGIAECELVVHCDGARSMSEAPLVEETRRVAKDWVTRLGGRLIEPRDNLGLYRSITSAVTPVCEEQGRVIVLEDDLVVGREFLRFVLGALDRYAEVERVMQISGFQHSVRLPSSTDGVFLPHASSWGWATWRRAWRLFEPEPSDALPALANQETRRRFDLEGAYPFSRILEERLAGRNQSWGVLWYWTIFRRDGLVLQPTHSLVSNEGFDGSGVHCTTPEFPLPTVEDIARPLGRPLRLPQALVVDAGALQSVQRFLNDHRRPSLTRRALRRFRRWLG